jgi:hypothetical protein
MTTQELIEKNRQDTINLDITDGEVVIPQGWIDEYTAANGYAGGIDSEDKDIYCYLNGKLVWVAISDLTTPE